MVQNGDGEIAGMLEAVEAEVREEAAVLSRKRISLAGMAYLSNTVILPRVLYKLKFSHASVKQIDKIQSSLLDAAAKKAGLTAAAHKVLYGGYMGCGWKKWSDEVNIERLKMVLQGWQEENTTYGEVIRGALHQLQTTRGGAGLVMERSAGAQGRWETWRMGHGWGSCGYGWESMTCRCG